MRKFLLSLVSLVVLSALLGGALSGCESEKKQSDTLDTTVVNPQQLMQDTDTTGQEDVLTVTGEVVDAMKSNVTVKTDEGEKEFEFEDLRDSGKDYYHSVEGDMVTVKYVEENGEVKVVSIEKAEE